jgi:hypothetical protein
MSYLETITLLKTKQKLNLSELPDGVLAVFTGSLDSKLATTVLNDIEENYSQYQKHNLSVFFATQDDLETDSLALLYDPNRELANSCSILCKKNDQCEALLYFEKKGDQVRHLYTREQPQHTYNWIEQIIGFAENFQSTTPDQNNLWRFGQKVIQPGEYLCVDCGYIESFKEGDIYPICEVCLSGDPEGPTDGPNQGYWEYLA